MLFGPLADEKDLRPCMTASGRERSIRQASKMNAQIALRKAGIGQKLPRRICYLTSTFGTKRTYAALISVGKNLEK